MNRNPILALAALAAFSLCAAPAARAQSYTITDLGTLPGGSLSEGNSVNSAGQVTGYSDTASSGNNAFLYANGGMIDLGTLGGQGSQGFGINNGGQVTGYAYSSGHTVFHAFLYSDGSLTDLGTFGGSNSVGYGLNDSGQVTGYAYLSGNSVYHAFLYSGGQKTDLGILPGGKDSEGFAINANGEVTGSASVNGTASHHAFLYSGGTLTDLGTLGGQDSQGKAINAAGQVAGSSEPSGNTVYHAFFYSSGHLKDMGTLGGGNSQADGLSDGGQIVGYSDITGNSSQHAFYSASGSALIDLNSLISSMSGWVLNAAISITDNGNITGYGVNPQGATHAFLLQAIKPTLTSLSPSSKAAGSAAFTLTVSGAHFAPDSVVLWKGIARTTTFVSPTKLTAHIPASLIATAGTAKVAVTTPGVGTSGSKTFTITP